MFTDHRTGVVRGGPSRCHQPAGKVHTWRAPMHSEHTSPLHFNDLFIDQRGFIERLRFSLGISIVSYNALLDSIVLPILWRLCALEMEVKILVSLTTQIYIFLKKVDFQIEFTETVFFWIPFWSALVNCSNVNLFVFMVERTALFPYMPYFLVSCYIYFTSP